MKIQKTFNLYEIESFMTAQNFDIKDTRESDPAVIIDGNLILQELLDSHYSKKFIAVIDPENTPENQLYNAFEFFMKKWARFKQSYIYTQSFERMFDALISDFNPIENYDRYEDSNISYVGKEENKITYTGKQKDTMTHTGIDSVDTINGAMHSESVNLLSADNSESFVNDNKNTTDNTSYTINTSTTRNTTDENTTTFDNRNDTSAKSFDNRKDITTSHIHGNIGVTTASAMITEAYNMYLKNNLMYDIIKAFTDRYLFY